MKANKTGFGVMMYRVTALALLLLCSVAGAQEAERIADTRILIDISGSMKQNDPQNLRRPAVRLLVGLLPQSSRAGVWTFGQYVNMQVPLGMVDDNWRGLARAGASKIGSPGQYTNIEDAIRRSISDWEAPSDRHRRHLVLLTDGMVDVSKNPADSSASRQRILDQLLPRLKEMQAQVHTIALSERADHELMKALAGETGGWYEQVESAEQLQRIFLRIFEKVGKPDTLPLTDNRFTVDASIEEVTLLIFRQPDAPPTQVITPAGDTFNAESAPDSVKWYRDEGYDMLTISQPQVGEWKVQAAIDPDNRVVVVTNLKMKTTELPNRIVAGEKIPLTVHFTNAGKLITRQEFLEVVSLSGVPVDAEGLGEPRPIADDGSMPDEVAGDGRFSVYVGEGIASGKVEYIINAEGRTFQREQRQLFQVADPVSLQSEPMEQGGTPGVSLRVTADTELLDMAYFALEAELAKSTGEREALMLLPGSDGNSYQTWINTAQLQGSWMLNVTASGRTAAGNDWSQDIEPVMIEGKMAEAVAEPVATQPEPVTAPEEPEPAEESYGVKEYSIMFGIGNLLLVLIAGVAFMVWRKRAGKADIQLIEDEMEDESATETEAVAESSEGEK